MDCKSSSEPGHIFLKPKKPKVIERKVVKQRKSCNLEPIVPLHHNFNCRPQAVLKFEPLPPIRYYDPTCETHRLREAEKRALEKLKNRRLQRKLPPIDDRSNFTPPALDGRLHQKIQTEMYLEELKEFRDERNNFTQTDLFIGRPPTPYFIPEKIGLDKQTQIYDGDLFDFDVEVQPVLEVLVGKLVEQALLEVQEEEELAALREQQRIFEELRNAEFEEQQRLEEQERRIKQEKMERLRQEISRLKHSKLLEKKIAAVSFSEGYVGGLISATFGDLVAGNYFYDDKEKDIEVIFMQNIVEKIAVSVTKEVLARKVLDDILRIVVKFRHDIFMMINSKDWEEDATEKENKKALRRAVLAESYDPSDIELTSILDIVSKTEIEREFVVNQIKNIFFLKHMPRSHLFAIADGLLERHVAANENIYTQGDVGDEFYIVKKGQFEVHANGMKVGIHDDSGYFGEMALMYNVQRRNTVKAATDGLLWYVKRSNFKQILTKSEHQARRNNVEFLKKVNIFKNMTETEFEKTADALRLVHFDNEEIIVKQGEKADSLMIIENGKALLTTVTESYPKGKEDYIETGAYFGELALLSEIVRSSTVTAVGDVYVLVLDADTFSRMVGNCHEIVSRAPPPTHKDKPKKARLAKEH